MGRKLSLVGVALVGFLGPLEYSVVMPSLWYYLKEFDVTSQAFYSFVLSSFSLAHMIASPCVGWLADRRPMKELLIVGLLVSAVGHALYAMAWDEWGVLFGRFIAGLGASNFTLVSVYVARITTHDNRTTVTARLNIFTEMGLLLGPAFAILFEQIDFYIGPLHVNQFTAPGYVLLVVCLLLSLYLLFFFENPPPLASSSTPSPVHEDPETNGKAWSESDGDGKQEAPRLPPAEEGKSSARMLLARLRGILTLATVTVLFTQFILFFNQTSMEALMAPLTEYYYDFGPLENSLIFVGITVVFLVMYVLISLLSSHVQDRTLIALGLGTEIFSLLLSLIIFLTLEDPPFWLYCIATFFFVIGLPFFFCCTSSLVTKLVEERDIGLASGLLSSSMQMANILGPLWGGTFAIAPWMPFAGDLVLVSLLAAVFSFSFRSLYIPKGAEGENTAGLKGNSQGVPDFEAGGGEASETTPLIN